MAELFEQTVLSGIPLQNRLVRSATWEGLASADGKVTPALLQVHEELAKGGVGLIISSYMYVQRVGKQSPGQIGVHSNAMIPGLAQLAQSVYDRDGNQSIEREELQDMFTSMLLNGESVTMDEISPEMRELIVDFVDGIYDTFDADHSESLEFDEVMQALQKSPEIDVWEVFGRTLINSS